MTEPFASPENTVINSDFVERRTMSFSLWTVVAEHSKANSRPQNLKPGVGMHPQSTDDWVLRLHSCRALSPQPRKQAYATSPMESSQKRMAATFFIYNDNQTNSPVLPLNQIE